jgi:hypothetical protein
MGTPSIAAASNRTASLSVVNTTVAPAARAATAIFMTSRSVNA